MSTGGPSLKGIAHVALTVSNLSRSVLWYERLFDTPKAAEVQYEERGQTLVVFSLPGMVVALSHFRDMDPDPFDERRIGLDHISFDVGTLDELQAWVGRFDELGIPHSGVEEDGGARLIVVRDPDGIQLEFYVTPVR